MKFNFLKTPSPHLIIENVFSKKIAKKMFDEVLTHKNHFILATTGSDTGKINKMRSNTVLYIDTLYNDRKKSVVLTEIDKLIINKHFQEVVSSMGFPFHNINATDTSSTQISRYGSKISQKYDWHIDGTNRNRQITLVYYFLDSNSWEGGKIELSDSPILYHELIEENPKIHSIQPIPNSCVVFSSYLPHRVTPTISSDNFELGRFSANVWIGNK